MVVDISKVPLSSELGSTGLNRTGWRGQIIEEFLPELSGERARKVYREMRDNDPVVGAIFFVIEMLIRQSTWRVEGPDEETVEFTESCMHDMTHTWDDLIAEILSMLTFGYSWHEVVYKRRLGEQKDPNLTSRYNDGKIGWQKIPIRAQDTLSEWVFDETTGDVKAFVQIAPPTYKSVEIPMDRSLLFRVGLHKGNPEGRSLLRNAYRPWWFKKRLEEIEGIGIERDLAGLPVIERSIEMAGYDTELKKILRNIRRDEQEGLLLPLAYDENGKKLLEFKLMSSPGQRQINISQVIDRYDKRIAMTCLGDFILLGQQAVGSFALASSKTAMFAAAVGAILKSIAEVMNRYAIPRLLALNGWQVKEDQIPRLIPGDLETPDLQELGAYVTALAGAGMPLFPDDNLEEYLRRAANLPAKPEEGIPMPEPPAPKTPKSAEPKGTNPKEEPEEVEEPEETKPKPPAVKKSFFSRWFTR